MRNGQRKKKRSFFTVLLCFLLCAAMIGGLAYFAVSPAAKVESVQLSGDAASTYLNNRAGELLSEVIGIQSARVLPYDFSVPEKEPDPRHFYEENGMSCYKDSTIVVKCWSEPYHNSNSGVDSTAYYADVMIQHPSQFRRQWAHGDYNARGYQYPSNMFLASHGVVGMSGDFHKFRNFGIVIQYGTVICDRRGSSVLDVLTVDYDGNFHIWRDDALRSRIREQGADDIMLSFTFGPALVENGHAVSSDHWSGQVLGELYQTVARAAIGQLGERHYLFCTLYRPGLTCRQMAELMESKGCVTAYNLDGGQTGTLLFNGKVYNKIAYKGVERAMSDIMYFASAES